MKKKIFPYHPEVENQLKKIKLALHVRMNGEISDNMAQKGVSYKLNYGTLLPELKDLSKKYVPHKLLAERLWHTRIRETMILATYLYPVAEFSRETADEWIEEMPTREMINICCMNLFSALPYAEELISAWMHKNNDATRLSAWLLLARIYNNLKPEIINEHIGRAVCCIKTECSDIQAAMVLALKKIAMNDPHKLLAAVDIWQHSDETKMFYDEIKNEVNFYLDF